MFTHTHKNLSVKAIGTYITQFDTLIKFMDYYLDRDYREVLTLPITALTSVLISEYKYYLRYELCLSENAVKTALRFTKAFINWNNEQ
ncbi:MAG: hypothetical protein K0R92_2023 [Lachnospiraceae bacterium]|jgi:hypothetical protein|nr:hypothetical protein [Lachnospiraceae bacterium]